MGELVSWPTNLIIKYNTKSHLFIPIKIIDLYLSTYNNLRIILGTWKNDQLYKWIESTNSKGLPNSEGLYVKLLQEVHRKWNVIIHLFLAQNNFEIHIRGH